MKTVFVLAQWVYHVRHGVVPCLEMPMVLVANLALMCLPHVLLCVPIVLVVVVV